jgi:hypothetical protein
MTLDLNIFHMLIAKDVSVGQEYGLIAEGDDYEAR